MNVKYERTVFCVTISKFVGCHLERLKTTIDKSIRILWSTFIRTTHTIQGISQRVVWIWIRETTKSGIMIKNWVTKRPVAISCKIFSPFSYINHNFLYFIEYLNLFVLLFLTAVVHNTFHWERNNIFLNMEI